MAGETHILNLKAVLDTTQVKQQLDQLRQQQQQTLGGGAGAVNANGRGISNVNGLTSTLNRLNITLQQLQRSLAQGFNIMRSQLTAGNVSRAGAGAAAMAPLGIRGADRGLMINQVLGRDLIKMFFKENKAPWYKPWVQSSYSISPNGQKGMQAVLAKNTPAAALLRDSLGIPAYADKMMISGWLSNNRYATALYNQFNPNKQPSMLRRGVVGMFAHQGAGVVQDALEMNGYDTASQIVGGVGKVGSYAMMGSTAGPWGALAGGAIGAIETMFDVIKKRADEIAAEVDEWNAGVQRANDFRKMRKEFRSAQKEEEEFRKVADSQSIARLTTLRAKIQARADNRNDWLNDQERLGKSGAVAGNVNEIQAKYEKDIQQLQQIDDLIDQINHKKAQQKLLDEKQMEQYDKLISKERQAWGLTREARVNNKDIFYAQNNVDMLGYSFAEDTMSSGVQKYRKKAYDSFFAWKDALREADRARTPEHKREALEKAQEAQSQMHFAEGQANNYQSSLVSFLQDRLNALKAPDMSSTTSIAAMGFGMGEKDDSERVNMMEQHLREQSRLQKQIKDLIADGVDAQITF